MTNVNYRPGVTTKTQQAVGGGETAGATTIRNRSGHAMTDLIRPNYLKADKVPAHVINYKPAPEEYSGMGLDAMLDLKARALIQHAKSLGNEDVDSVKRYIDSLDTLEDPSAMEIQKKASSYFDRSRMSYEDQVTLDTLFSGGDFLDALATSLGATREEASEYLDEINTIRTGERGGMLKVPVEGYLARPLAEIATGIYSDRKDPVRRYGLRTQGSAQMEWHDRSYAMSSGYPGFLMVPWAAAEELLQHPPNLAVVTPEESRLRSSRDRVSNAIPGGYEAFSPAEFSRALSSVKHSLIRGIRKRDPSLTLIQAERLANGLMIPMLEERSEYIRGPRGVPGRSAKLQSIKERFPLDREDSKQLINVLRVYDGENNGTFEMIRKRDEKLADEWREAVKAVKQRFESGVYPNQIASVSRRVEATHAASKGGDATGSETAVSEVPISEAPSAPRGGPRIVINPKVFADERDALCVAFNEALRLIMEEMDFEPMSEPTDKQREFFADTAYAENELQLRRTILARIATLDTSVSDPTDEQIEETMELLESTMEIGAPQNEWEQSAVQRLHDLLGKMLEVPAEERGNPDEPTGADIVEGTPDDGGTTQGDVGGGVTEEEEEPTETPAEMTVEEIIAMEAGDSTPTTTTVEEEPVPEEIPEPVVSEGAEGAEGVAPEPVVEVDNEDGGGNAVPVNSPTVISTVVRPRGPGVQ